MNKNQGQDKDDPKREQTNKTNQTQYSKLKQFLKKLNNYFSSIWNCDEFFGLVLYYIGLVLRFIPNNMNTFIAAR